jgi:hypothetical protein
MNHQPEQKQIIKLNRIKNFIEKIDISIFNTEAKKNDLRDQLIKMKFMNKLNFDMNIEKIKILNFSINLIIDEVIFNLYNTIKSNNNTINKNEILNLFFPKPNNQKKKDKQKERKRRKAQQEKEQEAKET